MVAVLRLLKVPPAIVDVPVPEDVPSSLSSKDGSTVDLSVRHETVYPTVKATTTVAPDLDNLAVET